MVRLKQSDTFRKWEMKLKDRTARSLIAARILRLSNGLEGDVSSVGGGILEMRIHFGPGYRIYFTWRGEELVILLCGGDKKSQARDILTAKRIAADWLD